jgi:hypothetical protein
MSRNHRDLQKRGRLEDWMAILDAYRVQFLVLDAIRDRDLLQLVQSQPGWAVDFEDEGTVLFARTGSTNHQDNSGCVPDGALAAA